jgi:hypothetical protein
VQIIFVIDMIPDWVAVVTGSSRSPAILTPAPPA